MEYLIPLAIVAVAAVLVVLGYFGFRTAMRKQADRLADSARRLNQSRGNQQGRSPNRHQRGNLTQRVTPTAAAQASARLDEDTHRQVYRYLAIGQTGQAAEVYRQATGVSVVDAMLDVQAMSVYPQEWVSMEDVQKLAGGDAEKAETSESSETSAEDKTEAAEDAELKAETASDSDTESGQEASVTSASQGLTDLTVPTEWEDEARDHPIPQDPGFHVEVIRQEGTVRLSSEDLPPWLRDQIAAMVRDARFDEAASLLSTHSMLTESEALDLLRMLAEEQRNRDAQRQSEDEDNHGGDDADNSDGHRHD